VARAQRLEEGEFGLRHWLDDGYQADMRYMEEHAEMRQDPRLLVEGARTVISLLLPYKYDRLMEGPARIAQYAYDDDYHERMKGMLLRLLEALREQVPGLEARAFVDTAPISDKHWAARAGLGWIGCNTLLVNPHYGSYCFLGELVTAEEADSYDTPLTERCGDCRSCVEACPNGALVFREELGIYQLDARRCTSYNTVENRADALPEQLHTRGYLFGCDICQQACPYNRQAPASRTLSAERKAELEELAAHSSEPAEGFSADEAAFRKNRRHSALSRIKYPQWRRNKGHQNW